MGWGGVKWGGVEWRGVGWRVVSWPLDGNPTFVFPALDRRNVRCKLFSPVPLHFAGGAFEGNGEAADQALAELDRPHRERAA